MNPVSQSRRFTVKTNGKAGRVGRYGAFVIGAAVLLCLFSDPGKCSDGLRFKRIGVNQGLSQRMVTCILQDRRGFLWIGTTDGLNRYDGYGFTVYRNILTKKNSLSLNFILSLHEDRSGALWVGTGEGLGSFMFGKLIEVAKEKGISEFTAEVLAANRKMFSVFHRSEFNIQSHLDEASTSSPSGSMRRDN